MKMKDLMIQIYQLIQHNLNNRFPFLKIGFICFNKIIIRFIIQNFKIR